MSNPTSTSTDDNLLIRSARSIGELISLNPALTVTGLTSSHSARKLLDSALDVAYATIQNYPLRGRLHHVMEDRYIFKDPEDSKTYILYYTPNNSIIPTPTLPAPDPITEESTQDEDDYIDELFDEIDSHS